MKKIVMTQLQTKTQKRCVRTILFAAVLVVVGQALLLLASSSSGMQQPYEAYYNYLGNYPYDAEPEWSDEAQGLAHDRDNWFITQRGRLWKIPVTQNLNNVDLDDQGVIVKSLCYGRAPETNQCFRTDMPELISEGYNHLGDPDYFEFGGEGFVLVPLEGGRPAIGAFRADTLQYVNHAYLTGQTHAGWCAVDRQDRVYSSSKDLSSVNRYAVDWSTLLSTEPPLTLPNPTRIHLTDESGSPVEIRNMQGGELSPSGQLMYVSAGHLGNPRQSWGIHVFDLSTKRRIQRSTNGSGHFNYEFDSDCVPWKDSCFDCPCEEPEGLTIWDLDDVKAPCSGGGACINGRLQGQLHVILLDNDPDDDDVYIKHYTNTIYVDRSHPGIERGTPSQPFKTVGAANKLVQDANWNGARIKIKGGNYQERVIFSKRIEVVAERGTATIGQ